MPAILLLLICALLRVQFGACKRRATEELFVMTASKLIVHNEMKDQSGRRQTDVSKMAIKNKIKM